MYWGLEDKSTSIWESRPHFPPFHYKLSVANVSATFWADSAPFEAPCPGFLLVTPLAKPQKPSRNSHRLLYERYRLIHLLKMVSGIFSTTFALWTNKKSACSSRRSRSPNTGHKKLKAGAFSKSNHKYVTKHSVASTAILILKGFYYFSKYIVGWIALCKNNLLMPWYKYCSVSKLSLATWVTSGMAGETNIRLLCNFNLNLRKVKARWSFSKQNSDAECCGVWPHLTFFTIATCLLGIKVFWVVLTKSTRV